MTTTLPAINSHVQKVTSDSFLQSEKERQLAPSPVSVTKKLGKSKVHGKRDRDIVARLTILRNEQPYLTKPLTSQYRNSRYQELCTEILKKGYHEAFAEVYSIVEKQEKSRQEAGPDSAIWALPKLPDEYYKLSELCEHLCMAEKFSRENKLKEVYQEYVTLATFFQNTSNDDHWLVKHFFQVALDTVTKHKENDQLKAIAHRDLGLAFEESGENQLSLNQLQNSYLLCKDNVWGEETEENGESLIKSACIHLSRVYTKVANDYEKESDFKMFIELLSEAYQKTVEAHDELLIGESAYRLGMAYNKNQQPEDALKFLEIYLAICETGDDNTGIGKACHELSKAYELSGNIEKAISLLQRRVTVAEAARDDAAIAQSCSALGAIFNLLGRYSDAVDYFNKAYTTARASTSSNLDSVSSSRVLYGVAAAHKMLSGVETHIDSYSKVAINRLLEWKDQRQDLMDKKIPDDDKK